MTEQQQPERHLMVDIETLGVQPNTAIFSIGAVVFDINTGEIFEEFYQLINPSYADNNPAFNHSASTIGWWCAQSAEATAELAKAIEEGNDWQFALLDFERFVSTSHSVSYWAQGQFDLPILSYHLANISFGYEGTKPLDFRKFRDMRTTLAEADINPKDYADVGVRHNALDDCKFQVICLVDAWKRVTAWKSMTRKDMLKHLESNKPKSDENQQQII